MAAMARAVSSSSALSLSQHHPINNHSHPHHHLPSTHTPLNPPTLLPSLLRHKHTSRTKAFFPSHAKPSPSNPSFPFRDSSDGGSDERYGGKRGVGSVFAGSAMAQRSAEADVMGLLLNQRIVFLGHEMNDFVADATVGQLLLLDAKDSSRDIRLFINCPGGSMSAAMAIFDAIQLCRSDVSTVAFGLAASTASIVLAGGTRGKRFAMPNTRIMVHQPMGGASGQALDVEIQAKEIMHHKANCLRILSQITGRSIETVEKDIDRDRYMSPVEALEYGLIDGVIDKDSIIPLVPLPEKVSRRPDIRDAETDPYKFLIPVVPDNEIY